jgi:phospho-N-acetylmuramoyl-pentapeptide-transferase
VNAVVGAFIGAFLLSVLFGNKVIELLRKLNAKQAISEDAPDRHLAKQGTPTMGGLLILGTLSIAALLFGGTKALAPVLISLAFGAIGFLDDFLIAKRGKNLGLKARQKMALQILFAAATALWLWSIHHSTVILIPAKEPMVPVDLGWFYYVFVVFLLVAFSNAVNLGDGLDGLCAGTMIISIVPFTLIGASHWSVHPFSAAVAGACLGFLWFNFFPAKVFMGDTGSLGLGAAIAMTGILTKLEILLVLFGAIYVAEALSVSLQVTYFKLTHGKRIFRMSPPHHHFELCGWEEQKVVVRFWIIQALFSALGFWLSIRMFAQLVP